MAYNGSQKLMDNIAAIRVAIAYPGGKELSDTDIADLQKYSGFGGIKAILYPYGSQQEWVSNGATKEDLKLHAGIIDLHNLLKESFTEKEYKGIINSLKNSVLSAFYTPEIVPQTLFDVLEMQGVSPRRLYEPSAGSGVFIAEAVKKFPGLEQITAVEKDILTGLVLSAINEHYQLPVKTHVCGLEETPVQEKGQFDLVVSNIPFGNFSVYDQDFSSNDLTGRIHNYFFAKGLEKLADGGLMAFLTTDAFLNSPSNDYARKYLFEQADLVSLNVMPNNLMKDTGNTEAASHLLIVQKNSAKGKLSWEEDQLCKVIQRENEFGTYNLNSFIAATGNDLVIGNVRPGTNQYGKASEVVTYEGEMAGIKDELTAGLSQQIKLRFNKDLLAKAQKRFVAVPTRKVKKLTYQSMPENKTELVPVQLGLFDTAPAGNLNRALAYISTLDETVVVRNTARLISTIRTTDNPNHEAVALVAAKRQKGNSFLYKIYSNVKEVSHVSANWITGSILPNELKFVVSKLKEYDHAYLYEGDQTLNRYFVFDQPRLESFQALKPFYKDGTLVLHHDKIGRIEQPDSEFKQAVFKEIALQADRGFYKAYINLRDSYLELSAGELSGRGISLTEREALNAQYTKFFNEYGLLNGQENRRKILEDTAFGFKIMASLERREGSRFVKADILTQSIVPEAHRFETTVPTEALAHCLNHSGKVDLKIISGALGIDEQETINRLGDHIYLNPVTREWETADQYLSGNVVEKLRMAELEVEKQLDHPQIVRSFEAIKKVQPERIPFDLLDFNLGERWLPLKYYEAFGKHLFELETKINYFSSVDSFKVRTGHNTKIDREFAVTPRSEKTTYGYTLFEHALENTSPFYTYEVTIAKGITRRVPDNEAIQLAHEKIEKIRSAFLDWLRDLPDSEKKRIEDLYNETFNCYVLREYDGSHLTFPGLDCKALGIEDLYSSQKNAVWRIIQNRGALIDHEVGLGKTLMTRPKKSLQVN